MAVSKKIRFEVFKRDSFTCQYCGSKPPQSVLECDHINPKSKGGSNNIDNLITSCFDCNRGKSNNELTNIPRKLSDKAEILKEKELQLSEYNKMIKAKRDRIDDETWEVIWVMSPDAESYNRSDFKSISTFIERLGLEEVLSSADSTVNKGIYNKKYEFKYFCGVCWNKIKECNGRN